MDEEELNRDLSQPLAGKDPSTVMIPTPGIILCLLLYLFVIALFVVVLFVAVLCVILHPPVVADGNSGADRNSGQRSPAHTADDARKLLNFDDSAAAR
jgi:hypothetical protein